MRGEIRSNGGPSTGENLGADVPTGTLNSILSHAGLERL
jgi:hypothetical protein